MERTYFEEQTYTEVDFTKKPLPRGDYEYCVFNKCDFANTDLSAVTFIGCAFNGCNLSSAKLGKTGFRETRFRDCKMLGLHFQNCDEFLFSVRFENCSLSHSSFFQRKLKATLFRNCTLKEVDFSDADLTDVIFDQCDLADATFENTVLERTDFRTAFHYALDPELNRMKKARFSREGLPGLLAKYKIQID